jgi:hypothetical protein
MGPLSVSLRTAHLVHAPHPLTHSTPTHSTLTHSTLTRSTPTHSLHTHSLHTHSLHTHSLHAHSLTPHSLHTAHPGPARQGRSLPFFLQRGTARQAPPHTASAARVYRQSMQARVGSTPPPAAASAPARHQARHSLSLHHLHRLSKRARTRVCVHVCA